MEGSFHQCTRDIGVHSFFKRFWLFHEFYLSFPSTRGLVNFVFIFLLLFFLYAFRLFMECQLNVSPDSKVRYFFFFYFPRRFFCNSLTNVGYIGFFRFWDFVYFSWKFICLRDVKLNLPRSLNFYRCWLWYSMNIIYSFDILSMEIYFVMYQINFSSFVCVWYGLKMKSRGKVALEITFLEQCAYRKLQETYF